MTNTPAFVPGGARYLVLPDPIEAKSETIGEVTITERPDPYKQASSGTVVAKGKTAVDYDLRAWISYGQFSGYDQTVDGIKYKVLQENEILGELLRTPFDSPPVCIGCGCPLPEGKNCCMYCSPEARLTIYEAIPVEVPMAVAEREVCNHCFRSDGTEHYGWCATLLPKPAEEIERPQAAVPKPPPTPGVCSDCGAAAGTPTSTTCLDCMPF